MYVTRKNNNIEDKVMVCQKYVKKVKMKAKPHILHYSSMHVHNKLVDFSRGVVPASMRYGSSTIVHRYLGRAL